MSALPVSVAAEGGGEHKPGGETLIAIGAEDPAARAGDAISRRLGMFDLQRHRKRGAESYRVPAALLLSALLVVAVVWASRPDTRPAVAGAFGEAR
jgi:hypothetical protein